MNGRRAIAACAAVFLIGASAHAARKKADPPPASGNENDYYKLVTIPHPGSLVFEVSGLDWLDAAKTRLVACTRRGEVWVLDNVYGDAPPSAVRADVPAAAQGDAPATAVRYKRMLFGMHEPLGVLVNPGRGFPDGMYLAQRGELTRLVDSNGDDRIDLVETFCNEWEISGSYHEYAFGPKMGKDGMLWVTLNRPFGGGQEGTAYWRGWAVKVDNRGRMHPVCPGIRSPAGLGTSADGEMFYTDNQGDHVAVCKLGHLKPDVFHGNPTGLGSVDHPRSNFKLPFKGYPKKGTLWGEAVKVNPKLIAPAVWFPYPHMGRSHTDVITDRTGGTFGPFAGQTFVGDLSTAQIVRVTLEKVGGEYQGAVYPFRRKFTPPVLRMVWGKGGTMFVGGSSRGWGGGARPYGLQRLDWTGKTPFEILEMRARPQGFKLTFTLPVDRTAAANPASYAVKQWTYNYHQGYGDKPRNTKDLKVARATVGADGRSVTLEIPGLLAYYVHEVKAEGVRSKGGGKLLHDVCWYTLNKIPAR